MPDRKFRLKDKLPSQLISWLGILGGVMTVVSNLETVLTLSNWAHTLVSNWSGWMRSAWSAVLALIGVSAPSDLVLAWWTLSLFILATAFGARLAGGKAGDRRVLTRLVSFRREDFELLILLFVLAGLLILPRGGQEANKLAFVLLTAPAYMAALLLSYVICDTRELVARMRLVLGAVVMILALNWISALFLPAAA